MKFIEKIDQLEDRHEGRGRFITFSEFREVMHDIREHLSELYERMEILEASGGATQVQIDALTAQVNQVANDLSNSRNALQTEIDNIAQQGVDISGLQAALAPLDAQVQALSNLSPVAPAPTPPAGAETAPGNQAAVTEAPPPDQPPAGGTAPQQGVGAAPGDYAAGAPAPGGADTGTGGAPAPGVQGAPPTGTSVPGGTPGTPAPGTSTPASPGTPQP